MDNEHFLAKNNPTDMKSYNQFMKEQNESYKKLSERSRLLRIKRNLDQWEETLEDRWKKVNLNLFSLDTFNLIEEELNSGRPGSFLIKGKTKKAADALAYSLVRKYIELGKVSPSGVKWTSVSEGFSNINGMYNSRYWRENIFNKNTKLIVITGASNDTAQQLERDNVKFWNTIQSFCLEQNISCFITYVPTEKGAAELQLGNNSKKTVPLLTSDNDFNVKFMYRLKLKTINADPRKERDRNEKS